MIRVNIRRIIGESTFNKLRFRFAGGILRSTTRSDIASLVLQLPSEHQAFNQPSLTLQHFIARIENYDCFVATTILSFAVCGPACGSAAQQLLPSAESAAEGLPSKRRLLARQGDQALQ